MSLLNLPLRLIPVLLLTLTVLPAASTSRTDVSGAYDDEGTIAEPPPGEPPRVISLHALLTLQFIPGVVQLLHDQTGEVRLTLTPGRFHMAITNRDGEVAWERTWREGDDFGLQEGRIVLRYRAAREGEDDYFLRLESVTAYKLLQVEVQRHTPSILGPKIQPLGTYLFHRAE
jgi:hypothetical protein